MTERPEHEQITELLVSQWETMAEFGAELDTSEWATPTELPGWTVKDNYSHVIGSERALLGEPVPDVEIGHLEHLTAPSAVATEPDVELRRSWPAAEVLEEFREVTTERAAALRTMAAADWHEPRDTPVGRVPYLDFMQVRQFDCWMHEQDCRRALDRPGHVDGPAAEQALDRCTLAMPFVVGKKAAAPAGSTVVFDLTGPSARRLAIGVEGRAALLDAIPDEPDVTLTLPTETFWCLGGGRWDPDAVLARGDVGIDGDRALGESVVRALNFMI